jgi:hypothetical protein
MPSSIARGMTREDEDVVCPPGLMAVFDEVIKWIAEIPGQVSAIFEDWSYWVRMIASQSLGRVAKEDESCPRN